MTDTPTTDGRRTTTVPDPLDMEQAVSRLIQRAGVKPSRLRVHPDLWRAIAQFQPPAGVPHPISTDGTAYGLPMVVDAELPRGGWRLEYDGMARQIERPA